MSQQNTKDMTDEMKAMAVLKDIADGMDRFYDKVRYYQQALEEDERMKKKFPDNEYMGKQASKYGKEVAETSNLITQGKFRGFF